MSQGFKSKYDQMRENALSQPAADGEYNTETNIRNICFVQPDGNKIFLNYGYLVSGEFKQESDTIILTFTSHTITLEGSNLEPLFYQLMQHAPKEISYTDQRYNSLEEDNKSLVNKILFEKMKT